MSIDTLHDWPLIVTLEDVYVPEIAQIVTATISEQAELTITLLWNFAADEARRSMTRN